MLNRRKSIENTIAIINPENHKSIYNTFKITLGHYFLIRLIDLIAEIAFLQVSLTCCLKLSSLSSMTPKSLTLSDSSIIVLPKLRKDRVSNKARGKLNYFGLSRVTKQHVLRVPFHNGINTISQSS